MTSELNFDVPEQKSDPRSLGIKTDPLALQSWRNELPLTNPAESARLFLEYIRKINQADISTQDRFIGLQYLQTLAIEIVETLRNRYTRAMLPLSERNAALHEFAIQIYVELCIGYKSVLFSTIASNVRSTENLKIMVQCLYWSLHDISLLMLEFYLIYAPIPAHAWEEANSLYGFAEKQKLENISIRPDTPNEESGTIAFTYKRALLMSLSNPYHLMLEEASTLFDMLEKLAHVITIYLIRSEEALDNCFVVDLRSDSAPHFISEHNKVQCFEPRQLDLKKLIGVIHVNINKLLESQKERDQNGESSLMIRMQRDLLARLVTSWGRSNERSHERTSTFGKLEITIGLSSSHNVLSHGQPFSPELDEIHVHTSGLKSSGLNLSLLPKEYEHWKSEEAEKRLESGIDMHRQSHFDDQSAALDKWAKIYAVNPKEDRLEESEAITLMARKNHASDWDIRNTSEGGMSLHCHIGKCVPVMVGEIIAYLDEEEETEKWTLGTIRWLHAHPDKTLNMGIMHLSRTMLPIAARAIKGIGKGGEYMRCLIVDSDRLDDPEASLVVPASIYDRGSELAINLKDRIEYIELTELVIGTKSFAKYRYRLIERPESEVENIRRLKMLV